MSLLNLITIDNGNTNPHVGVFKEEELQEVVPLSDFLTKQDNYLHYNAINSSVGKKVEGLQIQAIDISTHKKDQAFLDMKVNYSNTLGDDRLVQAYFVYHSFVLHQVEKVLLIDAGTFTTADVVSKNGFEGGYIFPGNQTYLNSYGKGEQLPTFKSNECNLNEEVRLPNETKDAILEAYKLSTKATFKSLIQEHKPCLVLLTGGQSELLKEFLQKDSEVSIIHDPNLIHYSLFFIGKKIITPEVE